MADRVVFFQGEEEAISLLEVPQQLHQAERAVYETLGGLRPLLEALHTRQRTPELDSAAFLAVQAGQLLESCVHTLRSARAVFAAEAELEARARSRRPAAELGHCPLPDRGGSA